MNSRERFLAALAGETVDKAPTAHVSALTSVENQVATGCYMPDVHLDPERLARLGWANHELLGFDAVSFIVNYFNEPAALGAEIDWGSREKLPMYLSHPWQRAEEAVVPPDLLDRPPVRTCLQVLRIAQRDYGDRIAVLGKVMGPLSMVQVMHGVENVMMGLVEYPDAICHMLDAAADILIECANAQLEAGADAVAIGEGGAGSNMLSPTMHEQILLGVHQRMVGSIQGPVIMHICGDIVPRLHLLSQTGVACFNFDWNIRPAVMKEAARSCFRLMGNVSTADLLNSTVDAIERQVFDCLDSGIDIISPGCAVSPLCPNQNLRAITDARDRWYVEKAAS